MRKFFVLLTKELRESLTPQMIVPLLAIVLAFMMLGNVVGKEAKKSEQGKSIALLDLDHSSSSALIAGLLSQGGFAVHAVEASNEADAALQAQKGADTVLLVLPQGLETSLKKKQQIKLPAYTFLRSFSLMSSKSSGWAGEAYASINNALSDQQLSSLMGAAQASAIRQPVVLEEHVGTTEKIALGSAASVLGLISSQTTFVPIILFLVIIFAAQLVAVAMATEKENKTLETLLTTPVSRKYIISAKLIAAGIVSVISSALYMVGLNSYVAGVTGGAAQQGGAGVALESLGLTFSVGDYALIGVSLFAGILTALSVALIIGMFAQDTKSVQSAIAPLIVLVIIPYFLTMFIDVHAASPALRYLVYAIPFSHPFLATQNILLGDYAAVLYGIVYLLLVFVLMVYTASRLFSTDALFTFQFKRRAK